MKIQLLLSVVLSSSLLPGVVNAAITLAGPPDDWTTVTYPSGIWSDFVNDVQASDPGLEIVGDEAGDFPSLFYQFDNNNTVGDISDDEIAFRIRLASAGNQSYFKGYAWIGLDLDLAPDPVEGTQTPDLFIGFEGTSRGFTILLKDPGTDSNISPSSTSLSDFTPSYERTATDGVNFDWVDVDQRDGNGTGTDLNQDGDPDYFLSFIVPFQDLVAATDMLQAEFVLTDTSPFAIAAITSKSEKALNADLNGVDGLDGNWEFGDAVPEPSTYALWLGMIAMAFCVWHRRRK